jgi:hypothetical protein
LFSDLVQFLLRNFAKESKASLKAFVGGIHEQKKYPVRGKSD